MTTLLILKNEQTWLAINNFDYQLAWKFHCQSCQYLQAAGIHRLDVIPAQSHEEEDRRNALRTLYWHVLQTDFLFRMLYGKPSALPKNSERVNPPSAITLAESQPSRSAITIYIVWIRYTIMTKDLFRMLDNLPSEYITQEIAQSVEEYCNKLEELATEWDLVSNSWNMYFMVALIALVLPRNVSQNQPRSRRQIPIYMLILP